MRDTHYYIINIDIISMNVYERLRRDNETTVTLDRIASHWTPLRVARVIKFKINVTSHLKTIIFIIKDIQTSKCDIIFENGRFSVSVSAMLVDTRQKKYRSSFYS